MTRSVMKATTVSEAPAAAIALVARAHADVDTDFAKQLHRYCRTSCDYRDGRASSCPRRCMNAWPPTPTDRRNSCPHKLPGGAATPDGLANRIVAQRCHGAQNSREGESQVVNLFRAAVGLVRLPMRDS
jgi:hypothetical protein